MIKILLFCSILIPLKVISFSQSNVINVFPLIDVGLSKSRSCFSNPNIYGLNIYLSDYCSDKYFKQLSQTHVIYQNKNYDLYFADNNRDTSNSFYVMFFISCENNFVTINSCLKNLKQNEFVANLVDTCSFKDSKIQLKFGDQIDSLFSIMQSNIDSRVPAPHLPFALLRLQIEYFYYKYLTIGEQLEKTQKPIDYYITGIKGINGLLTTYFNKGQYNTIQNIYSTVNSKYDSREKRKLLRLKKKYPSAFGLIELITHFENIKRKRDSETRKNAINQFLSTLNELRQFEQFNTKEMKHFLDFGIYKSYVVNLQKKASALANFESINITAQEYEKKGEFASAISTYLTVITNDNIDSTLKYIISNSVNITDYMKTKSFAFEQASRLIESLDSIYTWNIDKADSLFEIKEFIISKTMYFTADSLSNNLSLYPYYRLKFYELPNIRNLKHSNTNISNNNQSNNRNENLDLAINTIKKLWPGNYLVNATYSLGNKFIYEIVENKVTLTLQADSLSFKAWYYEVGYTLGSYISEYEFEMNQTFIEKLVPIFNILKEISYNWEVHVTGTADATKFKTKRYIPLEKKYKYYDKKICPYNMNILSGYFQDFCLGIGSYDNGDQVDKDICLNIALGYLRALVRKEQIQKLIEEYLPEEEIKVEPYFYVVPYAGSQYRNTVISIAFQLK